MRRHDSLRQRADPARDRLPEVGVRLLGIHPGVRKLGLDGLEDAVERPEQILVPVQLPDLVEPVARLQLAEAFSGVVGSDADERRLDEAGPVSHLRPRAG